MSVLQALDRYFLRMAERGEADELGFTRENVSFAAYIDQSGRVVDVDDLRQHLPRKIIPQALSVPRPKRTSNVQPNFLWDKTAYTFGVDDGKSKRIAEEHAAFKNYHKAVLSGVGGVEVASFLKFIDNWSPEYFQKPPFRPEMLGTFFVFRCVASECLEVKRYIHEIPELRSIWTASLDDPGTPRGICLVTGEEASIELGHPIIKGVNGAQTAGAYLVSFNADAYTSYNKDKDGTNSPVSKSAAARYGAALNAMLARTSRNRLARPIGDATVAFWADTSEAVKEHAAKAAEDWFAALVEPPPADDQEAAKIRDALDAVAAGRAVADVAPGVVPGTRFHVLGLAPNAARLSVRYWLDDTFEHFAERLAQHHADLRIEPKPRRWGAAPAIGRLLVQTTALAEKFENIPPLLAGEVTRAVLAGTPYPRSLLAAALIRLRAGDDAGSGWHAAVIRAVLVREKRIRTGAAPEMTKEELVSLERTRENDPAYHLGRLFAALEAAQRLALGRINATIRDRYFGAASAAPAGVFPLLLRGAQSHVGKLRKERKDGWIEREIAEIVERLPPALPRTLKLEQQGRFAIGYYHQRQAQFAGRPEVKAAIEADAETEINGEDGDV